MSKTLSEILDSSEIKILDLLFWLVDLIRKNLLILIGVSLIFGCYGFLLYKTEPKFYEASSTFISTISAESRQRSSGGLSALLGVDFEVVGGGEASSFYDPNLFPLIISSQPFLLDLSNEKFFFNEFDTTLSLAQYFILHKEPKGLKRVLGKFRKKDQISRIELRQRTEEIKALTEFNISNYIQDSVRIIDINGTQMLGVQSLLGRIRITPNGRFISITTKMPESRVSAELNVVVLKKLMDLASIYETRKERKNLVFLKKRTITARKKFEEIQSDLAVFLDANQGVISEVAKLQEDNLRAEYQIHSSIYNSLANQLETSRLELEDKMPSYSMFQPVYEPLSAGSNATLSIVLAWILIGVGVATFITIIRVIVKNDMIKGFINITKSGSKK